MTRTPDDAAQQESVLLYQSAARIHPRRAQGTYARLRVLAMLVLLGLYYLLPWIEIDGTPLVWFDLPHRHFHVFGLSLAPQDLIYLSWLLLIAALTLFFFTTLAGRLFCGYACPQTVWTEAFLWIEHFVEGDRHARMKLDRMSWRAPQKFLRRGTRHLLWALFALFTGLTFVAYFVPARELFPQAMAFELGGWPLFWSLFYGFATWGNAGFMREQVCKYMCPYARFQSVMFDRDTLLIAYDGKRGEPRKGLHRKAAAKAVGGKVIPLAALTVAAPHATVGCADGPPLSPVSGERDAGPRPLVAGDCIDCTLCVQVCPTGIDIRDGLQYECIACAACIDACNGVMDSVGKPRGLIRYTSASQEQGKPFRLLRPRAVGYGVIWLALCIGFVAALVLRTPLDFDVVRDRNNLYRTLADGSVENVYRVSLVNKSGAAHEFELRGMAANGQTLTLEPSRLHVAAWEKRSFTLSVRQPAGEAGDVTTVHFTLAAVDQPQLQRSRSASFFTGASR